MIIPIPGPYTSPTLDSKFSRANKNMFSFEMQLLILLHKLFMYMYVVR